MAKISIVPWIAKKLKRCIGIVEDTDTASQAIASDKYVIWKGDVCKSTSAISEGDTLSSDNLSQVTNGIGNDLLEDVTANTQAIATLNGKIERMESTQFENSVTINTYTSSSNPYTFPNDGYLMISAGVGTNALYDVYVIASDSDTAVLARLNKRFTEASQVDSLFVRKGTRAYVADRSSPVTVAFREFKE